MSVQNPFADPDMSVDPSKGAVLSPTRNQIPNDKVELCIDLGKKDGVHFHYPCI